MKKLNNKEFIEKSKSKYGDKYNYDLVKYKGMFIKVKIFCNTCKIYFEKTPANFLQNNGCINCEHNNKFLNKKNECIKRAVEIHGNKYNYSLVEYKGIFTKVKIICPIHGEFKQNIHNHLNGHNCPKCGFESRSEKEKTTIKEFINKAKSIHGDKYNYNDVKYINTDTKVKIFCNTCKNYFSQAPATHLNKSCGCPMCIGFYKTTEKFINESKLIHGDKYNYNKVEYTKALIKVKIICPIHGEFLQTPNSHLSGQGCPRCKESKGERVVAQFLDSLNIKHEREKRFKDCKNIRSLPFDFYLPDHNVCIEYDGQQHYIQKYKSFGANKEKSEFNYKRLKNNDEIKNNYCKNKNITLIRIRFDESIAEKLKDLQEEQNDKSRIANTRGTT